MEIKKGFLCFSSTESESERNRFPTSDSIGKTKRETNKDFSPRYLIHSRLESEFTPTATSPTPTPLCETDHTHTHPHLQTQSQREREKEKRRKDKTSWNYVFKSGLAGGIAGCAVSSLRGR